MMLGNVKLLNRYCSEIMKLGLKYPNILESLRLFTVAFSGIFNEGEGLWIVSRKYIERLSAHTPLIMAFNIIFNNNYCNYYNTKKKHNNKILIFLFFIVKNLISLAFFQIIHHSAVNGDNEYPLQI